MNDNSPSIALSHEMLRDGALSLEARGFLAAVLSLGAADFFDIAWACQAFSIGEAKARRIVAELTDRGYCFPMRFRDDSGGRFAKNRYFFTDRPFSFVHESAAS